MIKIIERYKKFINQSKDIHSHGNEMRGWTVLVLWLLFIITFIFIIWFSYEIFKLKGIIAIVILTLSIEVTHLTQNIKHLVHSYNHGYKNA